VAKSLQAMLFLSRCVRTRILGRRVTKRLLGFRQFIVSAPKTARSASRRPWSAAGRRRLAAVYAVAVVLAVAGAAEAQDVSTQFWPELDTFVRLNDDMRVYVPASKTRVGTENSGQDGTVGIYLDYYALPLADLGLTGSANAPRARRLLLRVGYGFTAGDDGQPATNTLTAEATGRIHLPGEILLSDRNRFDLNFIGDDFDPRYRNRLRLERNVDIGKTTVVAYAYGELFYDFDQGSLFRTRGTAGFEVHVWDRFVPEVYFQRDFNKGSSGDVNGFGLIFSVYLR
jgi:Protein of unknown function (DUF2490)